MLFLLFTALAAGTLTPDLQRELVVELLSGDTTILHPPPPKTQVSLAAARILASAPAPLTPLGEEADPAAATPAAAAVSAVVTSMTAQQRRAVCELGTDARCASVAEAMAITQPAAVCEFFSRMTEPAGEPRAAFCHGLADALVKPTALADKPTAAPAAASTPAPAAAPAAAPATPVADSHVDAAALCADTVARVLPTARSLAAAQSWSGRISSECEDASAKRTGRTLQDPEVSKVCWDLDGRLAMALEQGFLAKETGSPDPYADEKPSAFCARFADGARRLAGKPPLLAAKEEPVDKTTVTVKTVESKAVLEEPVAEKTGEPKPEAVAKVEPKLEPAAIKVEPKPEAVAKVEPKPEAVAKVEPKPEAAAIKVEPKPEAAAKVEPKPEAVAKVEPAQQLVAAKSEPASAPVKPDTGLVALLRTLADQHALLDQCVALSQGLSAEAADSEDLGKGSALETALPFNQHDQHLLDECGKALQQRGAKVLAGLAQPGALLATRSSTTVEAELLDTALDSPWSAEVCSDMATSYLRMGRHDARRADFCRSYQAQFTATHDDVAQLRRKSLRKAPLTAKDAEVASEQAGSRFLEDAARAMAPGNAAAVMWELQAPLPASLLETRQKSRGNANSRGAALWRRR